MVARSNGIIPKRQVTSLSPQERADKAYECYMLYCRGFNYTEISRRVGLSTSTVKKLIVEHARTVERYRPETRTIAESQYRNFIQHCWHVIEEAEKNPRRYSPLVVAKAMEGIIQAQTRLDKFYGHETPQIHVTGDAKTMVDIIREYEQENRGRGNLTDEETNRVEEYIEDAEVLEEDEDG